MSKVRELLQAAGVDLSRRGGIPELQALQRHLSQHSIVVYSGLRCDSIMFDGQVTTPQRINLLYDGQHYHVITSLTVTMAKGYVCLRVTKVVREARSTGVTRRAMSARPFLFASRITLGFPAMSVTDILGASLALRSTNV